MKGSRWRGVVYCFLWYSSIFCGFFSLCCPMLPLLLFSNKAYRHAVDLIFATWELYPVALMELLFHTEFIIHGDTVLPWDRSVFIMNHRTRLDWNFLWAAMHYATTTPAHRLKFVLKSPIRHTPGPGWVLQISGFFFIHRKWEQDKKLLSRMIEYLQSLNHTNQVLIFPEGTDLNKKSLNKSNLYAEKNNLPYYKEVLHPKTTGFIFLVNKMKDVGHLDAVYDFSVGYPKTLSETELDVFRGYFPEEVHFCIKRYSASELPTDEEDLKHWLCNIWKDKEETLTKFYSEKKFDSNKKENKWPRPISNALHLSVVFWTFIIFITFFALYVSKIFLFYSIIMCAFFIILSFTSEGMYHIEINWFKFKHRQYIFNNACKSS